MRKALITLILAATAMTPAAAWAQDEDGGRAERIRQRIEQRQQARSESAGQRQERSEPRVERREARQAPQVQVQQPVAQRERRGDWGERRERRSDVGQRDSAYPQAWQGNPNDPRREHYERLERRNQYRYGTPEQRQQVRQEVRQERREDHRDWRQDRRDDRRDWRRDRRDDRRDWRSDRRDWRSDSRDWRRDWNRDGWRNDRRYDWQGWRFRNRSLFRLSPYYSPYRSHRYSRFSIGLFLEPLFYSQRYWIGDPYQYRLPYAPPGTQWVRYYNDVLLVDVYSGEVIDVIYDFFW